MKKKKTVKKLKKKIAVLETENLSLQESVLRAENNSREKSAFLSHMSHDIRTPLNGIIGMTGIAMKHFDDKDRVLDCLGKIDSSSKHLLSLINDILDMSRIESGRMVMNHERMDIREVINGCALIAESLLAQRKVDFVREFGIFHHPLLIGDELHLRQVLINILSNAIKFTPDGGKIFFQVKEVSAGDGKATYLIAIPNPVPLYPLQFPLFSCVKESQIFSKKSGFIPIPVSSISKWYVAFPSPAETSFT